MLVVLRYRVGTADADAFVADVTRALEVLTARPGCRHARLGRATDDVSSWVLVSEWESVGAYRRALSSYDVKLHAVPVLSRCLDEPTAFEVLAEGVRGSVTTHASDLHAGDLHAGDLASGDPDGADR